MVWRGVIGYPAVHTERAVKAVSGGVVYAGLGVSVDILDPRRRARLGSRARRA